MRTIGMLALILMLGPVCGPLATRATAACSLSSHCYARATFNAAGSYTGGIAYLTAYTLSNPSGGNDFATQEVWITNSNAPLRFVELGIINGRSGGLRRFWLDWSGDYGIFFHSGPALSLGTTYAAKISYTTTPSPNRWRVYWNGVAFNTSEPYHNPTALTMYAGSESTNDNQQIDGRADYLQKRHSDGTSWSYQWPGASISWSPGMWATWLSAYQWLADGR